MKKKVLFVINTLGIAGAERTLIALLNEFDKEKYEVSLKSIIPRGECFSEVPKGVKILNKTYSSKSVLSKRGTAFVFLMVIRSFFVNIFSAKKMKNILRYIFKQIKNEKRSLSKMFWLSLALAAKEEKEEYDLAVAFLEGASTYYVSECVDAKKKVTFLHVDYKQSGYLKEIDRYYYRKFEKIYCVSTALRRIAESEFPEFSYKIERFQNVVSDSLVKELAKKGEGFTDLFDGVRILTVGRLHEQKGYDTVIRAFSEALKIKDLNARWYVLGEGPERGELIKLIESLNLEEKFILLGQRMNTYPYVAQSDIYVHCTKYEGWSIAIAEAKILGVPMIISDTTNAHKQLPEGTFCVVERNETEIADAIVELVTNEEKRMAIAEKSKKTWVRPNDISKLYDLLA